VDGLGFNVVNAPPRAKSPGPAAARALKAAAFSATVTVLLRLALMGGEVGPPCLILNTAWGRFVLRAYSISDTRQAVEGSIAVRIQRQEPTLLGFVEALRGLGLSPKQREVALGLAKGSSNREIATVMGVSTNTVAYHVKQLFQRLDTHDREQMIAKILVDGAQAP